MRQKEQQNILVSTNAKAKLNVACVIVSLGKSEKLKQNKKIR